MKGQLSLIAIITTILILVVIIFPSDAKKMKDFGFTEYDPSDPLKAVDNLFDNVNKELAGLLGKEMKNHMYISNEKYVSYGDKVNVFVVDKKQKKPLEFTFISYFPLDEEVYLQREKSSKTKIYKIGKDKINIEIAR